MNHQHRTARGGRKRRGKVAMAAAITVLSIGVLSIAAPATSQNGTPPPEDPQSCPSTDETVVIRDGRAYRWADTEARLVSYQFAPGTFPVDGDFRPTYPQTKFDHDWGWGCLSVALPPCGQVDTTVIEYAFPGTLTIEEAIRAITNGWVLPGQAVVGSAGACGCPPTTTSSTSSSTSTSMPSSSAGRGRFTANSGWNPPEPCPPGG